MLLILRVKNNLKCIVAALYVRSSAMLYTDSLKLRKIFITMMTPNHQQIPRYKKKNHSLTVRPWQSVELYNEVIY